MTKNLRNRILIILGILAAAIYFTFPLEKRINLGLDLKGGMHLILRVETDKLSDNAKADVVLRAIEILRNRIDSIGVGETVIQRQGENQILVQLPGVTDREKALNIIGRVAQLEFRLVSDHPTDLKSALEGKIPAGYIFKNAKDDNEPILLEDKIALSGETISDARVDFESVARQPYISMQFNAKGSKDFAALTTQNVGRRLAIIMDGEVLSAPNINEPITGGNAQITGQFSFEEASILALALRSGALPAPMHIEEERTIGPLLGKDSIQAGINAAIFGGALIIFFMVLYYLMSGIVACLALTINLVILFGIMGLLKTLLPESQLTLTLPGIAGIILTLGMAVDANVLINERIREEIAAGRNLMTAINSGFNRAWSAIIDSNVTTLIAAFMLFQFGSGPIKGFAVTLTIGILASLFTAIFVSKTFFHLFVHFGLIKQLRMVNLFKNTKINFIRVRHFCYLVSIVLIITSIWAIVSKKDKAYGIDFVGGQIQEYKFTQPIDVNALRDSLKTVNLNDAPIQQFSQSPENVIIRTQNDSEKIISEAFRKSFPDNAFNLLRVEKVGPVVGKALRKAAIFAIVFALVGILIYVGFRFKHFDFAVGGVVALLHDVLIAAGLLVLMGHQIDLLVVTALLTIAGYSINDTIVIYDRVRENMALVGKKISLGEILNLSINQTLSRTILTTGATLLVVISLYLKGGEVLNSFALTLLIGFISGTYSTVFIASPIVLAFQKKK